MDIHSLNDEIPVEIINRNLLFIKKDLYYNRDESEGKPLYKNGKEYCKKRLSSSKFLKNKYNRKLCYRKMYPSNTEEAKMARERVKKAREERAKKAREERAKKAREEREKKAREERAKKAKEEREKKAREEREKKAKEEREKKAKEEREKKAREEREKKAKEEREKKAKEEREKKAREEREKKAREDKDNNNNDNENKDKVGGGGDDGDDNDNNNTNNNNNNNTDNNNNNDNNDNNDNPTPPELTNAPTNSYQTAAATFSPTSTYMSNASLLPSEDGRQKISVAGISVIAVILVGVIVLVGLAVYRKRNNMRRGAVRLYDEPDQNDSSVMPRYLSSISNMRSLRIPSMPPKVQLTRLSSATILLPFRENNPALSNNNHNNPGPSFNNLNNNYLSPYTKIHPNSPSGGLTVNENRDQNSQKTDSVQSQESYSTLESSFPIPPQRAFNDSYNTTPTSATFGDMYKIKPG